jgi:two-component sensor histidine kinase
VEISPFELSVDKAIPAGLILNEMISNALKHAFPGGRHGSIAIGGELRDGRVELSVQDDGAGISKAIEPRQRPSLGLKIIDILCRQLKGSFERPHGAEEAAEGTISAISFPYLG